MNRSIGMCYVNIINRCTSFMMIVLYLSLSEMLGIITIEQMKEHIWSQKVKGQGHRVNLLLFVCVIVVCFVVVNGFERIPDNPYNYANDPLNVAFLAISAPLLYLVAAAVLASMGRSKTSRDCRAKICSWCCTVDDGLQQYQLAAHTNKSRLNTLILGHSVHCHMFCVGAWSSASTWCQCSSKILSHDHLLLHFWTHRASFYFE